MTFVDDNTKIRTATAYTVSGDNFKLALSIIWRKEIDMRKKIRNLFMFLLPTVFLITGCASSEKGVSGLTTHYNDIISGLAENQYYAYAELEGLTYPVLLVTDGVFDFDQETQASFFCDVYYIKSDEPVLLKTVTSEGTAYPISYDKEGIYTAGHHYTAKYNVDEATCELVTVEYAIEEFAKDTGDEMYFYTMNGVTEQTADRTALDSLFEKYENAAVVNFKRN